MCQITASAGGFGDGDASQASWDALRTLTYHNQDRVPFSLTHLTQCNIISLTLLRQPTINKEFD